MLIRTRAATVLLASVGALAPLPGMGTALHGQEPERIDFRSVTYAPPFDSVTAEDFVRRLGEKLNRLRSPRVRASFDRMVLGPDSVEVPSTAAPEGVRHIIEVRLGSAPRDPSLWQAGVTVLSADARELGRFETLGTTRDDLLDEVGARLIVTLTKPIRILSLDFPMRRGDAEAYGGLSKELPHMLYEGLGGSSRIQLIDQDREAAALLQEQLGDRAGFDQNTVVALGHRLGANYVVTGDYWELDGSLWVDFRCVSIETGQVVFGKGLVLDTVTVRGLYQRMIEAAEEMRLSISDDFLAQPTQTTYLAVTGFSPYPDTEENRRIIEELVRSASRKLAALGSNTLRIRDVPRTREAIVRPDEDRWQASGDLGADLLLTVQMERTRRDYPVLNVDLFDPSSPRQAQFTRLKEARVDRLDGALTEVLDELLDSLSLSMDLTELDRAALESQRYRGLIPQVDFPFKFGAAYQVRREPLLDMTLGLVLDAGMRFVPDDGGHWGIQPGIRLSILGARRPAKAIGTDVMATVTYRFHPHLERNWFVGASAGPMGAFRFGTGDINLASTNGAGVLLGVEVTLASARKMIYQIEWREAFHSIPDKTVGGYLFRGGRPGSVAVLIGTTFD
ncbi:MAG TPA: hypothetical protein VJ997_12205 [Longimicrobiales bacterium]|nr:hypothetical protein [Longimicrobiales bacterium]